MDINNDSYSEDNDDCPVCYSTISGKNISLAKHFDCTHILCFRCLEKLHHETCPLCRAKIKNPVNVSNNILSATT